MEQLSRSEEQVMVALWACEQAATRRQIAANRVPLGRLYAVEFPASAGEKALCPHRKAGQQKPVHPAGAPPDLLRRGEQCPPANAVRR